MTVECILTPANLSNSIAHLVLWGALQPATQNNLQMPKCTVPLPMPFPLPHPGPCFRVPMCHLPGRLLTGTAGLLHTGFSLACPDSLPLLDRGEGWRRESIAEGAWLEDCSGSSATPRGSPLCGICPLLLGPFFPALPLLPWDPHHATQTLLHAYSLSLLSALPSASCRHRSLLFPPCFYLPSSLPSRYPELFWPPSTSAPKALLPTLIFTCFHWTKCHLSKKFPTSDDS